MIWALFEIVIPLLLTFILGLITGWLFWRWRRRHVTASEWDSHASAASAANENLESLRLKHDGLVQENSQISATMKKMGGSLDSRKAELDEYAARNADLSHELTVANETNVKLTSEVEDSNVRLQQLSTTAGDLDQERNRAAELQNELDDVTGKLRDAEQARVKLDEVNARNVDLTARLSTSEQSRMALQRAEAQIGELTVKANTADDLRTELTQSKSRLIELESKHNQANAKLAQLDRLETENDALKNQLTEARSSSADLEKSRARTATLEAELKQASGEAVSSEQHLARISDLERQLEACKKRSENLQTFRQNVISQPLASAQLQDANTAADASSTNAEIQRRDQRIADLERQLSAARDKPAKPASPAVNTEAWRDTGSWKKGVTKLGTPGSDHVDDLKVIRGIGPEMEKLLNSFEIVSWEQLAALTDDEVQKVDAALTDFPGRIVRDEWVSQAQEIMANGHVAPDKAAKKPKIKKEQTAQSSATSDGSSGDWRSGTTHFGTPGSSHRDDLKQINGIGPVLEKTLNDFGIKSWEQLAELKPDEVEKIDQAIAFPGRIDREEWLAQARELVKRFPDRSKRPNGKQK